MRETPFYPTEKHLVVLNKKWDDIGLSFCITTIKPTSTNSPKLVQFWSLWRKGPTLEISVSLVTHTLPVPSTNAYQNVCTRIHYRALLLTKQLMGNICIADVAQILRFLPRTARWIWRRENSKRLVTPILYGVLYNITLKARFSVIWPKFIYFHLKYHG